MRPLSRRAFLYGLAGAVAVAGCGGDSNSLPDLSMSGTAPSADFPLPMSRRSVNGLLSTSLDVRFAPNTLGTRSIVTRTFEGTIPGPTLRLQPGDQLKLRLSNSLPQTTLQPTSAAPISPTASTPSTSIPTGCTSRRSRTTFSSRSSPAKATITLSTFQPTTRPALTGITPINTAP